MGMIEYSTQGAKIGAVTLSLPEVQYLLENLEHVYEARTMLREYRNVAIVSYMPDIVWDEEDDMSSVQEILTVTFDIYTMIKFMEAIPELRVWVYG